VKCARAESAKKVAIAQAKLRLNKVTVWLPTVGPGGPVM